MTYQTSRRNFIKSGALITAGTVLMPHGLFASAAKLEHLGLQLYTVRDAMHAGAVGTLKKLADAGLKTWNMRVIMTVNFMDKLFGNLKKCLTITC